MLLFVLFLLLVTCLREKGKVCMQRAFKEWEVGAMSDQGHARPKPTHRVDSGSTTAAPKRRKPQKRVLGPSPSLEAPDAPGSPSEEPVAPAQVPQDLGGGQPAPEGDPLPLTGSDPPPPKTKRKRATKPGDRTRTGSDSSLAPPGPSPPRTGPPSAPRSGRLATAKPVAPTQTTRGLGGSASGRGLASPPRAASDPAPKKPKSRAPKPGGQVRTESGPSRTPPGPACTSTPRTESAHATEVLRPPTAEPVAPARVPQGSSGGSSGRGDVSPPRPASDPAPRAGEPRASPPRGGSDVAAPKGPAAVELVPEFLAEAPPAGAGGPTARLSRSEAGLLRIRTQIRQAKAVQAYEDALRTPEPEVPSETEVEDSDTDVSSLNGSWRTVCGTKTAISDLPRLANEVLQKAKKDLESSGNLRRDLRAGFVEALHALHEMVLRLSESRTMHMLENQRLKAGMARESEKRERDHSKALAGALREYEGMARVLEGVRRDAEASRLILNHDVCRPVDETLKLTTLISTQVRGVEGVPAQLNKLLAEVRASGDTDRPDRPHRPHRPGGAEPSGDHSLVDELQRMREGLAAHLREVTERPPIELKLMETIQQAVEGLRVEVRDWALRPVAAAPAPSGIHVAREGRLEEKLDQVLEGLHQVAAATANVTVVPDQSLRAAVEDLRREVSDIGEVTVETAAPIRMAVEELRGEVRRSLDVVAGGAGAQVGPTCGCEGVALEVVALRDALVAGSLGVTPPNSYSEAVRRAPPQRRAATHALLVGSSDPSRTSEQVLKEVEDAVDPRRTGVRVDRVRKVRDGRVLLGCCDRQDLDKMAQCLKGNASVCVEEALPRNPLIEIRDVLAVNTDDEILQSLRTQNTCVTGVLDWEKETARVRFRMPARNRLERHVVLEVSPRLWRSMMDAGRMYVGFQCRPVRDRSPLVQCSRCLGYGHPRRLCRSEEVSCAHCCGPHMRDDCPSRAEPPTCVNCARAKYTGGALAHAAFSGECPERQKWDAIARSRVAYC